MNSLAVEWWFMYGNQTLTLGSWSLKFSHKLRHLLLVREIETRLLQSTQRNEIVWLTDRNSLLYQNT